MLYKYNIYSANNNALNKNQVHKAETDYRVDQIIVE